MMGFLHFPRFLVRFSRRLCRTRRCFVDEFHFVGMQPDGLILIHTICRHPLFIGPSVQQQKILLKTNSSKVEKRANVSAEVNGR